MFIRLVKWSIRFIHNLFDFVGAIFLIFFVVVPVLIVMQFGRWSDWANENY